MLDVVQNQKEFLEEISDTGDAPNFDVKMIDTGRGGDWSNAPHQKLIIIDGLLAITGSANLTTPGWRKVRQGQEQVEAVTDLARIAELNNRNFSRNWANQRKLDGDWKPTIEMDVIPF